MEPLSPEERDMVKLDSEKNTNKLPWRDRKEQEDMKSRCHIAYTPNPIPTPNMQQRKNKEGQTRKKETSTPNVTKTCAPPLPPTKETRTGTKNRSTRKGNNQTKKIIPTKIQEYLSKLEPRGYIKNAAQAQSTRLYPMRRKTQQWSPLKMPVPEWQTEIIVGTNGSTHAL
jgi:hypothetical protein